MAIDPALPFQLFLPGALLLGTLSALATLDFLTTLTRGLGTVAIIAAGRADCRTRAGLAPVPAITAGALVLRASLPVLRRRGALGGRALAAIGLGPLNIGTGGGPHGRRRLPLRLRPGLGLRALAKRFGGLATVARSFACLGGQRACRDGRHQENQ